MGSTTRRGFLIASAAIVGGVAFGAYRVAREEANPLLATLKPGEASFNPWVKISKAGIVLITPHAELGQGVSHMQALLIAEELDLELGQFQTEFGLPSAAYWNRAMNLEAVPVLRSDQSGFAKLSRAGLRAAIKVLGMQATGGSTSTADSYDKLRFAGAIARQTLIAAASKKTGDPIDTLRTEAGAVIRKDGSKLAYTELAALAAEIDTVEAVTLRPPERWRLIGKHTQRLDTVAKSTGAQAYGIDKILPDMRYASVKLNPKLGGPCLGYDAERAKTMRGVSQIVELRGGVAVIADNTWRAMAALEAIECQWGEAPYPADMPEHWAAVEASFNEAHLDKQWRDEGDVEAAFAQDDVLSVEYRAPYLAHQPLEPLNATVLIDDERIDLWVGVQFPRVAQQRVAALSGYDEAQVYIHNQFNGGSFGHRLEVGFVERAVEIGLAAKGTPIKMTFSRETDFSQDNCRQIGMARARGSVKDGHIHAVQYDVATVSAMASQMARTGSSMAGADVQIPAGVWNLPYALANFRVNAYRVPELAPTSSWRSVGASTGGFFADCLIDELCHKAGADPLHERLRLANNDQARGVLEAVAQMSAWDQRQLGANQGRGVALVESFGVCCAQVVEISLTPKGVRIDQVYVAADVGRVIDPDNFENQVQGAVIWGLGHAINCEITFKDGMIEQRNYHAHTAMRQYQAPNIQVKALSHSPEVKGIGEPPVAAAAPALANAIFDATGQRLRAMPFNRHIDFV